MNYRIERDSIGEKQVPIPVPSAAGIPRKTSIRSLYQNY